MHVSLAVLETRQAFPFLLFNSTVESILDTDKIYPALKYISVFSTRYTTLAIQLLTKFNDVLRLVDTNTG